MDSVLPELVDLSDQEALRLYSRLLERMRELEIIATGNAPAGEYAELLAQRAFGGERQRFAHKAVDIVESRYGDLQVKAATRVPGKHFGFSPLRDLEVLRAFDFALFVVFDRSTYHVDLALLVPHERLLDLTSDTPHVRGRRLRGLGTVQGAKGVIHVTDELRAAQARTEA